MNSLKIDKRALESARKQFCLDIGLPWEEYAENPRQQVYIRKAVYREGTFLNGTEGARNYEGRDDFFHAMICLGQLFLIVDEQIYDWAVEKFTEYPVEWFCQYDNLRLIDEKLQEFGHKIKDTHVYFLPERKSADEDDFRTSDAVKETVSLPFCWYEYEEILRFKENNRFTSAICFSKTQPDMLAVAALKDGAQNDIEIGGSAQAEEYTQFQAHVQSEVNVREEVSRAASVSGECVSLVSSASDCKIYDQSQMAGMAGVSADGEYLWQIGINVIPEENGKGLAAQLVRMLKDEVFKRGQVPFYGTSESHTISQTVGLKAGFVPAWTEVFVTNVPES